MKTIVCNFNLFDAHQKVDLYNEDGQFEQTIGYGTLDKIATIMAVACEQFNAPHIKLIGNKAFLDKVAENTKNAIFQKYGRNDIEIEVN